MARADKAAAVAELTEEFRSSQAAVLTEYRGLTVKQLAELRESLGDIATYAVVKNTLTKIAAREAGVDSFDELLVGPSAIAFVKGDPVEAAKSLRDFARAHPLLVIKGGVLDGATLSPQDLARLADLESREVLLAKLAGAMKASLSGAAALFQAPLAQAARTVEALRAKREENPTEADTAAAAAAATEAAPAADADAADTASTDEVSSTDAADTDAADTEAAETTSTDEASSTEAADTAASDEDQDSGGLLKTAVGTVGAVVGSIVGAVTDVISRDDSDDADESPSESGESSETSETSTDTESDAGDGSVAVSESGKTPDSE